MRSIQMMARMVMPDEFGFEEESAGAASKTTEAEESPSRHAGPRAPAGRGHDAIRHLELAYRHLVGRTVRQSYSPVTFGEWLLPKIESAFNQTDFLDEFWEIIITSTPVGDA